MQRQPTAAGASPPDRWRIGIPNAWDLPTYLRIQAHANLLMNQRLQAAMAPLAAAELQTPRTRFSPT